MGKISAAGWMLLGLCCLRSLPAEELRVGTSYWPPYENISDPDRPGFCFEVVENVLKAMDLAGETREFPWARALLFLYQGEIDLLYSSFDLPERRAYALYPEEPLGRSFYTLFVRQGEEGDFPSLESIRGRAVGAVQAGVYADRLASLVDEEDISRVANQTQLFMMLDSGRIDCLVAEYRSGLYQIDDLGLEGRVAPLRSLVVLEENFYAVFSRETTTPDLVRRFSAALKAYKESPEYEALEKKYFP